MKKIRRFLGAIRRKFYSSAIFRHDINKFKNRCADSSFSHARALDEVRIILIQSHVVEKGMSHKQLKPLFGKQRMQTLAKYLESYVQKGGNDSYAISLAASSIEKYNEINRSMGVSEKDLIAYSNRYPNTHPISVGAVEIEKKEFFKYSDIHFSELCKARHSLRLYDCKSLPISSYDIVKCVETAQNCPNACNRQGVRVKIVTDSDKIKKITAIQGGSTGFGENSGAMLIITSDISKYSSDEHNMAMVDSGIFAMNLVYALYEKQFGTCLLNCAFSPEKLERLSKIVPFEEFEVPAVIVSVSSIPDDETVMIACSPKRNVVDIVDII